MSEPSSLESDNYDEANNCVWLEDDPMSEPSSPEEAASAVASEIMLPFDTMDIKQMADLIRKRDSLIRAEERERCARIAEYFDQLAPATIASAIRNQGASDE